MIRKRIVAAALALLLLYLLFGFYRQVIAYDPMAFANRIANTQEAGVSGEPEFRSAWRPLIVERNLFTQTRGYTPPAPEAPPVETAAPAPTFEPVQPMPNLRLNAIIKMPGGECVAHVQIDEAPSVPVRRGDSVSGFKVLDVQERKVTLLWNNQRVDLTLTNRSILKR